MKRLFPIFLLTTLVFFLSPKAFAKECYGYWEPKFSNEDFTYSTQAYFTKEGSSDSTFAYWSSSFKLIRFEGMPLMRLTCGQKKMKMRFPLTRVLGKFPETASMQPGNSGNDDDSGLFANGFTATKSCTLFEMSVEDWMDFEFTSPTDICESKELNSEDEDSIYVTYFDPVASCTYINEQKALFSLDTSYLHKNIGTTIQFLPSTMRVECDLAAEYGMRGEISVPLVYSGTNDSTPQGTIFRTIKFSGNFLKSKDSDRVYGTLDVLLPNEEKITSKDGSGWVSSKFVGVANPLRFNGMIVRDGNGQAQSIAVTEIEGGRGVSNRVIYNKGGSQTRNDLDEVIPIYAHALRLVAPNPNSAPGFMISLTNPEFNGSIVLPSGGAPAQIHWSMGATIPPAPTPTPAPMPTVTPTPQPTPDPEGPSDGDDSWWRFFRFLKN